MINQCARAAGRGNILIYVLWMILVLSLFAASTASQAGFGLSLTDRLLSRLQASYLVHGALAYARLALADDPTPKVDGWQEAWSNDEGAFRNHAIGDGLFSVMSESPDGRGTRYGLADEERRIDLNAASAEVLTRLFKLAGGLPTEEAARVAASVLDWRDADDREEPDGAESPHYRSLSPPYDCKNAPLESPEELLLVRGVTPELYRRVEPYVTVYGAGPVNLNTAGPMVLRALGLSPEGAAGVLTFRAGDDGVPGTADDRFLASVGVLNEMDLYVPVDDLGVLTRLVADDAVGVRSQAFRMTIEAQVSHRASRVTARAVMRRDGTLAMWSEDE